MPHLIDKLFCLCRKTGIVCYLLAFGFVTSDLQAAPSTNSQLPATASASETVITNVAQFWQVMSDSDERNRLHPVRMDLLIYYCDTNWNVYWGQSDGDNTFLPLRGLPKRLKFGDRVRIDGWALPVSQEFLWNKTSVRVLSESNHITALPADGKLWDVKDLEAHFVKLKALVASCNSALPNVFKLDLLADDLNLDGFVRLHKPVNPLPDWVGKMVRIQGVYVAKRDSDGAITSIALWTPGLDKIRVVGSLDNDPRFFNTPLVTSDHFSMASPHALVRVAGVVHSQQIGESVTIWDDTGQIRVLARQRQPLKVGDHIEAIGYPAFLGMERILQSGLFRLTKQGSGMSRGLEANTNETTLRLADEVRGLDQESLGHHPSVKLKGVVTCLGNRTNFVFVQDSSGGIRVMQTRLDGGRQIKPDMLVSVQGVADNGKFAPVISRAVVRQIGNMDLPDAPVTSLEQALTGTEDGRWIQMRGYVRRAIKTPGSLKLQLVARGGEFIARVPESEAPQAPPGAIVSVRGVCVADANSQRQLTGIEIWSDSPGTVQTEQFPPSDLFAGPKRPLASLRRFNPLNTLNKRVHTAGIVTLQVPGQYLYLQESNNSLLALSDQTNALQPGDRVEVVGFPGNKGENFLLREAVYRRIATGTEPKPEPLDSVNSVNEELDGLLVRAKGVLLDVLKKPGEIRLILQHGGHIFEAKVDQASPSVRMEPAPGSTLAITGLYLVQRDEYGKPLSFLLNLRNANDIHVLEPPPWWTLRRLLMLLLGGLPVFLLALFLAWQTRRKNRELQAAQDQLETRVRARTRELHEEAIARKRALDRLSEAQQRLILASRQAGMTEMATGILHNVGNILNSINVSASMIGDSVQRLRIEQFSKAAELLQQHTGNLADFLQNDPRGRALPGYLQQLADSMAQNGQSLNAEVESLAKQLDHVKAVVARQQNYARGPGFLESLDPVELMEDALQINRSAYERHGIEIAKRFDRLPAIVTDRHKVLQILINLLNNAKQALTSSKAAGRRVILRIHLHDPGHVRFEVSDNGIGISPENLDRIFSLGFTTKADGHGFGLHGGANSAREMGGRLFATSEGAGRGATFTLELPLHSGPERKKDFETKYVETKST